MAQNNSAAQNNQDHPNSYENGTYNFYCCYNFFKEDSVKQ